MSKQTINIGASPNDGTGTPLRTSFDYTNQNFTELYTAVGPSGNNIVVPGNATITGDLTVDTSTLKVDSTNNRVGIGTASPGAALEVSGSATNIFIRSTDTNDSALRYYVNGTEVAVCRGKNGGSYAIETAGTERLRIDSTGNVGIGITPSAWNNDYKAIDVGVNGCIAGRVGGSNTVDIISNGFRDAAGNYVYKSAASTPAARYLLDGSTGSHLWYSGVAGTAGNTIAGFTTAAMTLTTAGNLAFPTGKGIDFSAVTGGTGTATANVLNDYEEGTFTPNIGGTATYTLQVGRYTKIGNRVFFNIRLIVLLVGTGSTSVISGLPFAAGASSNTSSIYVGYYANLALNQIFVSGFTIAGASTITMNASASATATMTNAPAIIGTNTDFVISGLYEV